jgi:hypothetical protein
LLTRKTMSLSANYVPTERAPDCQPPVLFVEAQCLIPAHFCAVKDFAKEACQGCGALGVGDSCGCARFLASAALAVACCRRSASDFKCGFGVV